MSRRMRVVAMAAITSFALVGAPALASPAPGHGAGGSITDSSVALPTWEQFARVFSMQDHNTRVVVLGTTLLGLAAGIVGSFMLLRRRALIGDALAHATLPGIALAFMVMVACGAPGGGKYLPGLLLGAAATGLLGVGAILFIKSTTRIREDAALGIVLIVFFGAGAALMGIVQRMTAGNAAGLEAFIYGKTASLLTGDALVIACSAAAVVALCTALYKEFTILSFDRDFAATQGWPVGCIDIILMAAVTAVTVVGLQAVGLILIVALLITPPAAARYWTDRLPAMMTVSGLIGAASGLVGALLSALVPRLPAGAIIVMVAATIFLFSLVFGVRRGAVVRGLEQLRLRGRVGRQHLLRTIYELVESGESLPGGVVATSALLEARSWSAARLARLIRRARRERLLEPSTDTSTIRLTRAGRREAARVARQHRLWEVYLITHADVAPSHVDRDADQIEHVLGPEMIAKLEGLLAAEDHRRTIPSPHALRAPAGAPHAAGGAGA